MKSPCDCPSRAMVKAQVGACLIPWCTSPNRLVVSQPTKNWVVTHWWIPQPQFGNRWPRLFSSTLALHAHRAGCCCCFSPQWYDPWTALWSATKVWGLYDCLWLNMYMYGWIWQYQSCSMGNAVLSNGISSLLLFHNGKCRSATWNGSDNRDLPWNFLASS